jgi:hypothetical protein
MAPVPVTLDVLGPLRLTVAGTVVDVRGPKRRAVLALLALAQGRVVTADHLVDALWPDARPSPAGRRCRATSPGGADTSAPLRRGWRRWPAATASRSPTTSSTPPASEPW